MSGEIAEVEAFVAQAKYSGVKAVLTTYLNSLKEAAQNDAVEEVTPDLPSPPQPSPSPTPAAPPMAAPIATTKTIAPISSGAFIPIDGFAWDQGEYGSPTLTVYADLENVLSAKERVHVEFTRTSFDLTVMDLEGKNYRLLKQNLDKEIVPEMCKFIVKKNKVILKLSKKKGEYNFDHWTNLTSKTKTDPAKKKEDPMGGIMDMMKNMYDDGDEQTKKLIGEAMMKSRSGEKSEPPSMSDMDM